MKLSWCQALPAAILVLDVATASKCKHSPSGLSSSSSSTDISTTSSSEQESTSSSVSVEVIITTTIETSSSASSSVPSSSTSSDAEPSSSSSSQSSDDSFSATPTSSSATLTQSPSFSATTLSSSVVVDQCSVGLLDRGGAPNLADRLADCSAYNTWTVTPLTSTTATEWYSTSWSYTSTSTETITTTSPSPVQVLSKRTMTPHGGVTATGLDGTVTVRPTDIPAYMSAYCDGYEAYFDACSEGGVVAATSTAPVVTSTTTESLVQTCYGNYIFTKYIGIPFPFFPADPVTTMP
ncbi:uncharacterized protein PG986_011369 [Apiospora aurea]|uniref:Uncharacterized protein n=1 Tax=Apiospora aurea TaxID=335848 RepID=A0ABR1Q668_9PEZI